MFFVTKKFLLIQIFPMLKCLIKLAQRYKTALIVIFLIIGAVFLVPEILYAQTEVQTGVESVSTNFGSAGLFQIIRTIISVFLGIVGVLAVIIIMYGGFIWMTAQGDDEKVKKAQRILRNGIIGLVIIMAAYAIASFIINALLGATGGGMVGPGSPNWGSGGGALGDGVIQSHYPGRNAKDIPRNTSIVITFKEEMVSETLIEDTNENGTYGDCILNNCDLLNTDNIEIKNITDNSVHEDVKAFTNDNKTFVFKPMTLLGNSENYTNYRVTLESGILKIFNGAPMPAFGSFGGYDWQFEVSNFVDLTPPQIKSVVPIPTGQYTSKEYPRNMVVQINFDEPVNPLTVQGLVSDGFSNIQALNQDTGGSAISGQYMISNQYKTVEFITDDLCGRNTCGNNIYCLPSASTIRMLIRPASLDPSLDNPQSSFPFDGVVDMADNSFDGNFNGNGEGQDIPDVDDDLQVYFNDYRQDLLDEELNYNDNLYWQFVTSSEIDLVPPQVVDISPLHAQTGFDPDKDIALTFDKLMMSSSLKPDSNYGKGYCSCDNGSGQPDNGKCAGGTTCDPFYLYCVSEEDNEKWICMEKDPMFACKEGTQCVQPDHLRLDQDYDKLVVRGEVPRAYWISKENISENQTVAYIEHATLVEEFDYGVKTGSGLLDIMQNCYLPSAYGTECERLETGNPVNPYTYGVWTGDFPTCDLTQ